MILLSRSSDGGWEGNYYAALWMITQSCPIYWHLLRDEDEYVEWWPIAMLTARWPMF